MTSTRESRAIDELVPLADRQLYLQWYRVGIVAVLLIGARFWPLQFGLSWTQLAAVSGVYLILGLVTHRTWELSRSVAITIFGFMVLVDGLYLAVTTYGSAGLGTPLQYLVLADLVVVTLLASFRTGLKVALWQILLVATVYELELSRAIHPRPYELSSNSVTILGTTILLILVVTLSTSTFAAVNERELRRRNFDLHALARMAWKLEDSLGPAEIAQTLIGTLRDDFGMTRGAVITSHGGSLEMLCGEGISAPEPRTHPAYDQVERLAMAKHATTLVRGLDPSSDPWLSSVLPETGTFSWPLCTEARGLLAWSSPSPCIGVDLASNGEWSRSLSAVSRTPHWLSRTLGYSNKIRYGRRPMR